MLVGGEHDEEVVASGDRVCATVRCTTKNESQVGRSAYIPRKEGTQHFDSMPALLENEELAPRIFGKWSPCSWLGFPLL